VVCEVLAKRVESGDMNEVFAKEIINAVFRENAIKLFNL
jgi:hypothetical protein